MGPNSDKYTVEQKEEIQLAKEYVKESIAALRDGRLNDSEAILLRAKQIYEELGDRYYMSQTYNLLSIIYSDMGNSSMDVKYLLDALEITLEDNDYNSSCKFLNNLGSKFMYLKAYDKALHYFSMSLDNYNMAVKTNQMDPEKSQPFLLILNINISSIYSIIEDYDNALYHYNTAKELFKAPDCESLALTFKTYEGLLLWRTGFKDEVRARLDDIINTFFTTDYATDYLEVTYDLLLLLKEMKEYDLWKQVLTKLNGHVTDESGNLPHIELLKFWLEYYEEVGDTENKKNICVDYYKLYKEKLTSDYATKADVIELNLSIKQAAKDKKLADNIVFVDALTQIGNRNRLLEDSKKLISDAIATDSPLSIGLIDIDYFKECNDTYGHIKGDECLKSVAKILNDAVKEYGVAYRYGGDEFVILMRYVKDDVIVQIGQDIKERLEALQFPNEKSPISPYVTISQGYTSAIPEEGDSLVQLISLADKVLYSVKRYGRNNYKYTPIQDLFD